jgi:hypothetical protein
MLMARPSRLRPLLLLGAPLLALAASGAAAEDAWNPFRQKDEPVRSRRPAAVKEAEPPPLPAMGGIGTQPWHQPSVPAAGEPQPSWRDPAVAAPFDRQAAPPPPSERERAIERTELQPLLAGDSTGLPAELWQGVDARNVHTLVTRLAIPPRSPAVHGLWRRLWTATASPPGQGPERGRFEALRIEALHRSGLLRELIERLDADRAQAPADPLYAALAARARVGAGDRQTGCADARALARTKGEISAAIKAEMLLLAAYCAAADGDTAAAGLAGELVRAEGIDAPLPLGALDAIASGQPFKPTLPPRLSLMDFRFLALARAIRHAEALERAEPALLVALAREAHVEHQPARRVEAAEQAARINALDPAQLAEVYRAQTFAAADLAEPTTARIDPALRRALLFKAVEGERTPMKRARLARALLDEARRAGLYMPTAGLLSKTVEDLTPAPEIGWFAETAVEINLVAGRHDAARRWIGFAESGPGERGDGLQHWLVLVDLGDPKHPGPRGQSLVHAEQLAIRGRLPPDLLHRLATVLDALDYHIPIRLWEAASRTPQPAGGHLPPTGVLTELQDAAKKKEFARTVLLAMSALGPEGADKAHMIALGDSVRALRRAGLEADARRLALEAVFGGWPRATGN